MNENRIAETLVASSMNSLTLSTKEKLKSLIFYQKGMKTTPELNKREYIVRFSLFQPEKHLEELNTLRDSLPKLLKNHKVNIITKSRPLGNGFLVFLYVLLKETGYLTPTQCAVEEGRLLGYMKRLIGKKYTADPMLLDEIHNPSEFYIRFVNQK